MIHRKYAFGWKNNNRTQCGSVSRILSSCTDVQGGNHFSRSTVAVGLKRPTRESHSTCGGGVKRATSPLLLGLAPGGVSPAPDVTIGAVSSYLAFSPLPRHWRGGIFSVTLSVPRSFRCEVPRCSRGTLLCGVRTFLMCTLVPTRLPDPPCLS